MKSYLILLIILSSFVFTINNYSTNEDNLELNLKISYNILDRNATPNIPKRHLPSRIIIDDPISEFCNIFTEENATYVIRYEHNVDSLRIPEGSQLFFDGGSISGKIHFANTFLSGSVKLHKSHLSGRISNSCFHSGWICYGDGKHDDAMNINNIVSICDSIIFQEGTYLLESSHIPNKDLDKALWNNVKSHIGIFESNKHFLGTGNVIFLTREINTTLSIYSKPNDIPHSISNISIKNIKFKIENDCETFNEFKHSIKTIGVNGLLIENCMFHDFWGDALCLSHYGDSPITGERTLNCNVRISNNIIYGAARNNRNGISVISGKHIIVTNNKIIETSKKGMPGAIDIEPNNSAYTIEDIVISNNVIYGSNGSGICLIALREGSPLHNIKIIGNKISKVTYGLAVVINSEDSSDHIMIVNNDFSNTYKDYLFSGEGNSKRWVIRNNSSIPNIMQIEESGLIISELNIEH